jgi:hypothetical protein
MEFEDLSDGVATIKCEINGRNAAGTHVYGLFLCVVDSSRVIYHGELFSYEPIEANISTGELYSVLESARQTERAEELAGYERQMSAFITSSDLFRNKKNLSDPKTLEHKITYFCVSSMSLNAVSFLTATNMSTEELHISIPQLEKADGTEENGDAAEPSEGESETKSADDTPPSTTAVLCEPVLDPVSGAAVSDLSEGDVICCRLLEDSVFYKMMKNASPDFEGVVSGDISAIKENASGSVTLAINLSDGIVGTLKLSGAVRVKMVREKNKDTARKTTPSRAAIITAVAGAVAFLCVMTLLLRLLS